MNLSPLVFAATIIVPLTADPGGPGAARFSIIEATIPEIQLAQQNRLITTEQLVQAYVNRVPPLTTPALARDLVIGP